jgi:DNA-binding NarL/FixJ family response regulator
MIVDDHQIVREGLAASIKGEPDLKIAAQAADGATALELLLLFKPKVAVVDVSLQVGAKTVDTCRRRVMQKLEVTNTADLVKRAIALGLTRLG